jgi:hypothetical protein
MPFRVTRAPVSTCVSQVRELFEYIPRYKPHNVELDTRLKCFIPDYIPAVGEIDPFLKVRVCRVWQWSLRRSCTAHGE